MFWVTLTGWLQLLHQGTPLVPAGIAALCGAFAVRWHRTPTVAVLAGAAAVAVVASSGVAAALVVPVVAVLWLHATDRLVPRAPRRPRRPVGFDGVAAASAVLVVRPGLVLPAAIVLVTQALGALEQRHPGRFRRLAEPLDRTAAWLGHGLATVAMVPVAALASLLWAMQRVTRYDPLPGGGGWIDAVPDPSPQRLYAPPTVRPGGLGRVQRAAASFLAAAALIVVVGAVVMSQISPAAPPTSPAFAAEPQFDEVWRDMQTALRHPRFDPVALYRLSDVRSRYVNQVDGIRRTWQPPPCTCPRYTVWWFGGSAAWGFYQSDVDSLPSQVARAAWRKGIALEIDNYAVPGYTLSQEVQRFGSLTAERPAPDLAIFYDGANELDFQVTRNDHGRGDDESPVSYLDQLFGLVFDGMTQLQNLGPTPGGGTVIEKQEQSPNLDAPQVAAHAVDRYRRGVDLARRIGDSVGTRTIFAWQPTESTADGAYAPFDGTAPQRTPDVVWWRRLTAAARQELPEEVIDLSDAIDHQPGAMMPDWAHTNTAGARLIGTELVAQVLSDLPPPPR